MAKEFAKKFYNSKQWKQCRASYIISVFGLCEKCRKQGYIVHHKKHITPENIDNPNITLNHENLMYLCLECHNMIHSANNQVQEGLRFNEFGDLVQI